MSVILCIAVYPYLILVTMQEKDGEILEKPHTPENARRMLNKCVCVCVCVCVSVCVCVCGVGAV